MQLSSFTVIVFFLATSISSRRSRTRQGKVQTLSKIADSLARIKTLTPVKGIGRTTDATCPPQEGKNCGRAAAGVAGLLHDLFEKNVYDPDVRPVVNADRNISVQLGSSLQEVEDLEESSGHMRCRVMLTLKWRDYQLQWDPAEYGGLTNFLISPKRLWTPDIDLYNGVKVEHNYDVKARVTSSGDVTWHVPCHLSTTCSHEFRSDSWHCPLTFRSWAYTGDEVDLQPLYEQAEMSMTEVGPSEHFLVVSTTASRSVDRYSYIQDDLYPSIQILVKVRRKVGHPALYGKRSLPGL